MGSGMVSFAARDRAFRLGPSLRMKRKHVASLNPPSVANRQNRVTL